MQVNVYISQESETSDLPTLLVLPFGTDHVIPPHLQDREWRTFATADMDDRLLGSSAEKIRSDLHLYGYAVVKPRWNSAE